jgi:hypothetical protein
MSWNVSYQYACLEFKQELPEKEIRSMLAELAPILLQKHQAVPRDFLSLELIALDLEDGSISDPQALTKVEDVLWSYLDHIETTEGKTSLVVRSEYDSDYYDTDIADEIAKYLFLKTGNTHFIMRSAAFDKCGGYSHQWIGYPKEGEVVLEHTDDYFREMFEIQTALMVA